MAIFDKLKGLSSSEVSNDYLYIITSDELEWQTLKLKANGDIVVTTTDEFTYIMEDKVNSCYKIGKTKNNPGLRLNQLRTANPNISLVCAFPSDKYNESGLHKKFDAYRKDLEWFFATSELKTFINEEIEVIKNCINYYKLKTELELVTNKLFKKD